MPGFKLSSSLESRLSILIAGLLFALLLAVGHLAISQQKESLCSEKTEKYEVISRVLALSYAPLVENQDTGLYKSFAERFMSADRDISYIIIADSRGRTLFADSRKMDSERHRSFIGRHASGVLKFMRRLDPALYGDLERVTMRAMVKPNEIGTITVGFGSQSIDAALEWLQARLLGVFALAFTVGLLGAMSIAKTVSKPIQQLTTAARAVTGGDLHVAIPVSSTDEIGELADTFNRMIVALRESHERLVERANTDGLTDLYNHRYFQERLAKELSRADRYGRPLSIIMLDIDHFKALNDAHGHPVGDLVLQEMAKVLLSSVRDIDVVARYGGEEFAIILPETQAQEALLCAERLRAAVRRHCFVGEDGEIIPVTISLGVAQYPVHSTEREGLIMAADLAMYQAKSMGRNRAIVFSSDLGADKTADPYKLYLLLHATDISTIEAIAAAVDAKSQRPPGISRKMMLHAVAIAQELGVNEEEQNHIKIATLLHDIGKLGIPDNILNKKEPLTEEERRILRSHPALGYSLVQKSPHLRSMLPGILHHHEAWDGSGYPNCLKGEEIPLIARIVSVVDAYYAMINDRPYCPKKTAYEAMAELRRCAGSQFDPKVVEAFLRILDAEKTLEIDKAA